MERTWNTTLLRYFMQRKPKIKSQKDLILTESRILYVSHFFYLNQYLYVSGYIIQIHPLWNKENSTYYSHAQWNNQRYLKAQNEQRVRSGQGHPTFPGQGYASNVSSPNFFRRQSIALCLLIINSPSMLMKSLLRSLRNVNIISS